MNCQRRKERSQSFLVKQEDDGDIYNQIETPPSSTSSSLLNKTQTIEDEETISKRKQMLERNRIAGTFSIIAIRCREKRKHEQREMIKREEILSIENKALTDIVSNLKAEFFALRELLLAHDMCQCDKINQDAPLNEPIYRAENYRSIGYTSILTQTVKMYTELIKNHVAHNFETRTVRYFLKRMSNRDYAFYVDTTVSNRRYLSNFIFKYASTTKRPNISDSRNIPPRLTRIAIDLMDECLPYMGPNNLIQDIASEVDITGEQTIVWGIDPGMRDVYVASDETSGDRHRMRRISQAEYCDICG
ncbi:MAG: hypothetical protein EXX96DRAFT_620222 [Benjaminiella poitrasii]|nr:MAG: hypothetical protein EXX96DRAFT_620222 [Benjaminiella poitrasii]